MSTSITIITAIDTVGIDWKLMINLEQLLNAIQCWNFADVFNLYRLRHIRGYM